jgi:hypothetical protein
LWKLRAPRAALAPAVPVAGAAGWRGLAPLAFKSQCGKLPLDIIALTTPVYFLKARRPHLTVWRLHIGF